MPADLIRRLRRVFAGRPPAGRAAAPRPGESVSLSGSAAVAMVERSISEGAGLAATQPAAASVRIWRAGGAASSTAPAPVGLVAADPRGGLAVAQGLALSGVRATSFLSGNDLAGCQDLLTHIAGMQLPLVVHLACRATTAQGPSLGSGHESYHGAADSGAVLLFARNTQEAVDLTLVARLVAERALVPVLVAMDGDSVATSVQDVRLPTASLVNELLGRAGDEIAPPTPGQAIAFGAHRRRVPRRFDLEVPACQGALQGPESWGLGAAGRRPYFLQQVPEILRSAWDELAGSTGRRLDEVSAHGIDGAEVILVGQGSVVETAEALADRLRSGVRGEANQRPLRVGVLGVRCLRPFPAQRLAELLAATARRGSQPPPVVVLERADAPLAASPPLTRELWACGGGRELHTALYGLGGLPLTGGDLEMLCRRAAAGELPAHSPVYLGVDFAPGESTYPKRKVLLDQIARSCPDAASLGIRGREPAPQLLPPGSLSVAVHRGAGDTGAALAGEASGLLHSLIGGGLRSRLASSWESRGQPAVDWLHWGGQELREPGAGTRADVTLVLDSHALRRGGAFPELRPDGRLLVVLQGEGEPVLARGALAELQARRIRIVGVECDDATLPPAEVILGALGATLAELVPGVEPALLEKTRTAALAGLDESERELALRAFRHGLERVRPLTPLADDGAAGARRVAPLAVRHLGRGGETHDSLPRFWDEVGVLYRDNRTVELSPDPHLVLGTVPPLSSTFRDHSTQVSNLPAFDPASCTGCGKCWTVCPDSAVAPVVLGARELLEAGIGIARGEGHNADALRRVLPRLARSLEEAMTADEPPSTLGEAVPRALEKVLASMQMPEDRREELNVAGDALVASLAPLAVARTAPFFDRAGEHPELLAIALNPDACKGCGACVEACEPGALTGCASSTERVAAEGARWRLWERLPDTSGATIARAAADADVGLAAAVSLSRHCLLAMAGGDGAVAGSGAKTALRMILAGVEYHLQPLLQQHLSGIEELSGKMAARIRETMAKGLPAGELDQLVGALGGLADHDVGLGELASSGGSIDGAALARLVAAADALVGQKRRLERGRDGFGRSRAGMAVAAGPVATWAASFPSNPFPFPVAVAGAGEVVQLARGLLEGERHVVLEGVRSCRRARLQLDRPAEAPFHDDELSRLGWQDLDADERALCPPLLVLGDDEGLGGAGLAGLSQALEGDEPLKVIVLAGLGLGLDGDVHSPSPGEGAGGCARDLGLFALAHRSCFVLQSSIAHPEHLFAGVLAALRHPGPALIHVHAPCPERHGFPAGNAVAQARLAVASRAFPLLRYSPAADGVFGSRLDLSGNPEPERTWSRDAEGRDITPADWAATEARFHHRLGDDALTVACTDRTEAWRTLQELAGVVTPFTERVKREAADDVGATHEAAMDALRRDYEERIEGLRGALEREMADRLTRRLLALSGARAQDDMGNGGGSSA